MPDDPARTSTVAFWRPDGDEPPLPEAGTRIELPLALPGGEGVTVVTVAAVALPARAALPVLTRARGVAQADATTAFWGAAALFALQLAARGLL
ncbi:hypothetical protein G3I40_02290, partial [Streptomyces sp. SID14478]|uniref:hypothetical protein n=1 Tax=Streptomyces sp. SID14478 TaxID=2706073 RepID=UPI0013DA9042